MDYQELILHEYMKNTRTINTYFAHFLVSVAILTIYKSRQIMVYENYLQCVNMYNMHLLIRKWTTYCLFSFFNF